MNNFLSDKLIPYVGLESIKLGENLDTIRTRLKQQKIPFNQSVQTNKGCTVEVPWTLIEVYDSISLYFAFDILFEIVVENNFAGNLPNGICINMSMNDVNTIDSSLIFDEDEEFFVSEDGYWIEDDVETNSVFSIAIFIEELTFDSFFSYEWVKKYSE